MGLVLITHDLRVAFSICDRDLRALRRLAARGGRRGGLEPEPLHPYTLGLLLSEPPRHGRSSELAAIEGTVPRAGRGRGRVPVRPALPWATTECVAGRPAARGARRAMRRACGSTRSRRDARIRRRPEPGTMARDSRAGVRSRAIAMRVEEGFGRSTAAAHEVVALAASRSRSPRRERRPRRRVGVGQDDAGALPRRARDADARRDHDRRHRRDATTRGSSTRAAARGAPHASR